jgi:hypothetical protein
VLTPATARYTPLDAATTTGAVVSPILLITPWDKL